MRSPSKLVVRVGDGPNDLPWIEMNGQRLATLDHIDDAGRVAAIIAGVDPDEVDRVVQEVRLDFIREARQKLQARLDEGVTCPCCKQYAKRYKRKLNSSMAAALCWMWAHARDAWIEVPLAAPSWVLKAREYPKLAWWGLIEEKPRQQGSKARTSGVWRVTPLGADFVRGCSDVPRYAFVYNGEVQDFTETTTDIRHALGDRFDYAELMGFDR